MDIERVDPSQARADVMHGDALLVCAYDDERCSENWIDGALDMQGLHAIEDGLPTDQQIVFYCA